MCPDAMEQLRSLDPDDGNLVQDLITIFIEESPDLIDRASRGLDQGNAVEVERAAHSLKGGSRNFGAERLAALAYRLEQAGKRIDLTEATVLLPVIREAFEEVRSELLTYAGT